MFWRSGENKKERLRPGGGEERQIEAQEGQEKEVDAQGEQSYKEDDVSSRHITRWKGAWWIRIKDGSTMRNARGRRRIWRAARRAAEQARDGDVVEETQWHSEETGREKGNDGEEKGRERRSNTVHTLPPETYAVSFFFLGGIN